MVVPNCGKERKFTDTMRKMREITHVTGVRGSIYVYAVGVDNDMLHTAYFRQLRSIALSEGIKYTFTS